MIGKKIGGCKLTEEIGSGGFGTVYRAVQLSLERTVAVKLLKRGLSDNKDALQAFSREAKSAAKLEHPNIIPVYNYGCESGSYFIVMECVEGGTLDSMMREKKRFSIAETGRYAKEIASALDYAHSQEVVHGDLNPRNILIGQNGRLLIGDFFGCHSMENLGKNVVGVPEYISPEQARGLAATAKSDAYSFGIMLYEMLTGKTPFSESNATDTLFRQISSEPEAPSKLNPEIPKRIEKVVLSLLEKNPKERPSNCMKVVEEFDAVLSKANAKTIKKERKQRRPVNKAAVFGMFLMLGALGGTGYLIQQSMTQEKELDALAKMKPSKASYSSSQALDQSVASRYTSEMQRGRSLYDQGDFRKAATAFHTASKLRPDQLEPHMYLGALFVRREDYKLASVELKAAIKMDPGNDKAQTALKYAQSKLRAQQAAALEAKTERNVPVSN